MKKTILLFISVIIYCSVINAQVKSEKMPKIIGDALGTGLSIRSPTHADTVQAAIQNTVQWILNVTGDMKITMRKNDSLTADEYAVFLKGITEYLKEKEKQFAKKP